MAGTPTWPSLIEGQWNKIAAGVLVGYIHRLKSQFTYWVTTVDTGDAPPLDDVKLKSPVIFEETNEEEISSAVSIDVYIWIENADETVDSTTTNAIQVNV